jgi:hypothetical protein
MENTMATKQVNAKVRQIYVVGNSTIIRFQDLKKEDTPKLGNFELKKSHENYNAFYSLALGAAINRVSLLVYTKENITPTKNAEIVEMIVNW